MKILFRPSLPRVPLRFLSGAHFCLNTCVTNKSIAKPYLFWFLGLAFERKADTLNFWK